MDTALEVMRIILEYFGWDGNEIEVSLFLGLWLETSLSNILIFHWSLFCFIFQELFHHRDRRFMNRNRSIVRRIGRELSRYQIKLFTKRSLVREIGSRLPLKPCKRPYFEVNCNKRDKLAC